MTAIPTLDRSRPTWVLAAAAILLVIVVAGTLGAFWFIEGQRAREERALALRLGSTADARAGAIGDWVARQIDAPRGLAENQTLQLYLSELAAADGDRSQVTDEAAQIGFVRSLLAVAADRLGFAAPQGDYYDPRNSYLNEVLVRRCGIPITLSVLYLHAGRLAGLEMQGISFPGHFLVRCEAPEGLIVLDPYHRGASLSLDDLVTRLKLGQGEAASGRNVMELLGGVGTRDIVLRMLRNLKAIHLQAREWDHALTVVDWLVHADPAAAPERRDRGLVYQELECARAALADYEAYLGQAAEAEDVDDIRARTVELRKAVARLN